MSEPENHPTPPPASTPKTSAVPLKKETVRITLRARPGSGVTQPREATAPVNPVTSSVPSAPPAMAKKATAPIQLPSAPLPPPAAKTTAPVKLPPAPVPPPSRKTTSAIPVVAAPAPSAPPPSSPMPPPSRPPMAPPSPMAAPRPPVAPSAPTGGPPVAPRPPVPMAPGAPRPAAPSAPRVETGAATAPLAKAPTPMAPRPPGVPGGAGTAPMSGGAPGASTSSLPKATVKLQQTQPMARPSVSAPPSAPVKRSAAADSQQFYEEKDPEAGLMPLSVICMVLSAILMVVQMFGSDRVSTSPNSPIMVPAVSPVKWETKDINGNWTNTFRKQLPDIQ